MRILRSVAIAFSMFSRIPMPRVDWSRDNMRYTMAAFPLVGAVVGLFVYGWGRLASHLWMNGFLSGAGMALVPVLITGGIHLDGFCDTMDALASHAPPEKKQEILKDSNAGAFAVIGLACYLLAYAALASEVYFSQALMAALGASFVLSRALSGLAVVFFPCARDSGLAHTFSDGAARTQSGIVLGLLALASAGLMVYWAGSAYRLAAAVAIACALLVLVWYRHMAGKHFGGISGDLAGWFLQWCELAVLAALYLVPTIQTALAGQAGHLAG